MIRLIKILARWSEQRVDFFGAQNQFLGGCMIFNYIVPYFLWYEPGMNSDNALRMRFLGGILCGGIIARDFWMSKLKPYFPLYWHFSLGYCLLFYNFYMFMDSDGSPFWLVQIAIGVSILAILVEWRTFVVLLPTGVGLGVGGYCFLFGLDAVHMDLQTLFLPFYLCLVAMILNRFYRFVAHEEAQKQGYYFCLVANQVASILRAGYFQMTPGLTTLKKHGPDLLRAYKKAREANLISNQIEPHECELIKNLPADFQQEMDQAEEFIRIELGKFQALPPSGQDCELEVFSISDGIEEVLDTYPFVTGQKMLIGWQGGADFDVKASKSLFLHMVFNLIRNSLDQIALHGQGRVSIWIEKKGSQNYLYFKDTAGGAVTQQTPFLFDAFYSKTPGRVGLGLTFCKRVMALFHGKVKCKIVANKQITFRLSFPKVYESEFGEEKALVQENSPNANSSPKAA